MMIIFFGVSCVSLWLTCSAIARTIIKHKEIAAREVRKGRIPVSQGRTSPKPISNSEIPTNLIKLLEFLVVHESFCNFSIGIKLFITPRMNIIPPNIPCTIQSAVFMIIF